MYFQECTDNLNRCLNPPAGQNQITQTDPRQCCLQFTNCQTDNYRRPPQAPAGFEPFYTPTNNMGTADPSYWSWVLILAIIIIWFLYIIFGRNTPVFAY